MQIQQKINLPEPPTIAREHSARLVQHLRAQMTTQPMNFKTFMQQTLYAPQLGYYTAGCTKFNSEGDFITAPEISPLFGQCLATQIMPILERTSGNILEVGAGTGRLAVSILHYLAQNNALPVHYYILEVSADLKQRQQILIQEQCPDFFSRVIWLDNLPAQLLSGIIIANEVLDAMPITRFQLKQNNIYEYFVDWQHEHFAWKLMPTKNELLQQTLLPLQQIVGDIEYISEINLDLTPWLKTISAALTQGVILLIDYGFPAHEYYHIQRHMGTLMCHYRHHAHTDPFFYPGLQDITAHVDFSYVASAASDCDVLGYCNQAAFLLSCDLLKLAQTQNDLATRYNTAQAIKRLTLPSEMGELFKVIALGKDYSHALQGFNLQNNAYRLSL